MPSRTADAHHTFDLLHTWLGTVLGETIGYALTAVFTAMVVTAVTRRIAGRWMTRIGCGSVALVATAVVVTVLDAASITNLAGYVAWCLWLITMATSLWWRPALVPLPHGRR